MLATWWVVLYHSWGNQGQGLSRLWASSTHWSKQQTNQASIISPSSHAVVPLTYLVAYLTTHRSTLVAGDWEALWFGTVSKDLQGCSGPMVNCLSLKWCDFLWPSQTQSGRQSMDLCPIYKGGNCFRERKTDFSFSRIWKSWDWNPLFWLLYMFFLVLKMKSVSHNRGFKAMPKFGAVRSVSDLNGNCLARFFYSLEFTPVKLSSEWYSQSCLRILGGQCSRLIRGETKRNEHW